MGEMEGLTLCLCHGKKHRKILFLNYDKTIFIDDDESSDPDIVLNFKFSNVSRHSLQFNNIVIAFCPIFVITEHSNIYGLPSSNFYAAMNNLITDKGYLVLPDYSFTKTDEGLKNMKNNGFVFDKKFEEVTKQRVIKWVIFQKRSF